MGPRADVGVAEKKRISCNYREWNQDPSAGWPVTYPLYRLSSTGSYVRTVYNFSPKIPKGKYRMGCLDVSEKIIL